MELLELNWDWKYVVIIMAFSAFVAGVSFDMIVNWSDKKLEDTRILLIGAAGFGLAVLSLTTNMKITVLLGVILLTVTLAGLMAVDNRFGTTEKPWELYVIAIASLTAFLGSLVWVYYNTEAGEYIQEKGKSMKDKYEDFKMRRRVKREQKYRQSDSMNMNPLFEDDDFE